MTKKLISYYYVGIVIYLFLYYVMITLGSKLGAEFISPIGILFSFFVLFNVYRKSTDYRPTWLTLSLSAFIYALSDIAWGFCSFILKLNPNVITIFNFFYIIPAALLVVAGVLYMKQFLHGMNTVQLLLDTIAVSLSFFILFWFIIFKSNILNFVRDINAILLFIYILLDFMIITLIGIGFMSIRREKTNAGAYVTFLGAAIYACIDLIYSYIHFYNLDIPYSIADTIYSLGFIVMALGSLYSLSSKNKVNLNLKTNRRISRNVFLLAPIPIYTLLRGFDFKIICLFIFIFLIYKVLRNYVQNAIKNEGLLEDEKTLNLLLEEKVKERTKEIMSKNRELQYLAEHDFLTKTYNARYLKKYIDNLISDGVSENQIVVFYIDVDRFKIINDIYGHDIGDKLLTEISNRLLNLCLVKSIVARVGGDEFVLACGHNFNIEEIKAAANSIIDKCSLPAYIEKYVFNMSISIGISVFPKDATSRISLLKNADMAMYNSKAKGGNRYSLFDSNMASMILEKHEIELLLTAANFKHEFQLFYQPQININTNELVGMEALLRWNSPVKGNIPPDKFIKIAEEVGYIDKISDFVMETACSQIKTWNNKYKKNLKMGINVSPLQLESTVFIDKLNAIMTKYSLAPSWIDIEVTETVAMKGEATISQIFLMLNAMGISTSIDDFGTGYSSLSYIQQFSFDRIKIAKELVDSITTNLDRQHIVKAIITMADALDIITIAEGIETEKQLELLKELGCNEVQGYFYSKPIPAEAFEEKFLKCIN